MKVAIWNIRGREGSDEKISFSDTIFGFDAPRILLSAIRNLMLSSKARTF